MKLSQRRMTAPSLGGVLATRQGSLILALLCAVCAAGVLVFALGRYKTNVAVPVPQATVLVATGEIAKGTSGAAIASGKLFKAMPVAESQLSPGAISDASQIVAQTTSAEILPGQQLTAADFGTLAAVSLALKNGQRGVEIAAGGANGAVDITNANSRVDIWGKAGANYVLVAADVLVLKPATATPVSIGNQSVPGSTLVVELPNADVQTVLNHSTTLYLTLRPGNSGAAAAVAPTAAATTATPTTTTTGAGS